MITMDRKNLERLTKKRLVDTVLELVDFMDEQQRTCGKWENLYNDSQAELHDMKLRKLKAEAMGHAILDAAVNQLVMVGKKTEEEMP